MPSTKDATLDLIQREINEVVQREKELRANYSRSNSTCDTVATNSFSDDDDTKPPLERAKSVSCLTNGNQHRNGGRLFTQNITAKGVMQRFINSRGRMTNLNKKNQVLSPSWSNLDIAEPAIVPSGMQPRNGYVPVEERIRREFHDMHKREKELRVEREKSQPDLLAALDSCSPEPQTSLRSTVSVLQLNEFESYDETLSAPASLKGAKSLSDLLDIDHEEEEVPPGSHSLIKQWENLIKKNQTRC